MSDHSNLTDQVPDSPPGFPITNEDWSDFRPVPVLENAQFEVPPGTRPTDLFAVQSNRCTLPGYRFVRKNNKRQMLMFVDGACLSHDSRAGWAVCLGPQVVVKGRLEPPGAQTNSRAELRGAIVALGLRVWKKEGFGSIVIATDSEYVVRGYCEWLSVWRGRNWRTTRGTDVLNRDLWKVLDDQIHSLAREGVQVWFWRIPREWNEADKYARQAVVSIPRCCCCPDLSSLINVFGQIENQWEARTSYELVHLVGY